MSLKLPLKISDREPHTLVDADGESVARINIAAKYSHLFPAHTAEIVAKVNMHEELVANLKALIFEIEENENAGTLAYQSAKIAISRAKQINKQ